MNLSQNTVEPWITMMMLSKEWLTPYIFFTAKDNRRLREILS